MIIKFQFMNEYDLFEQTIITWIKTIWALHFYINADAEKRKLCMKLFSISCRFRSNEPSMLTRGIYRVRVGKLLGRNLINGTRFVWCYSRCRRPLPFPPFLLQIWTEFKLKVSRTFSGRFQHTRLNPELIKFRVWH